MAVDSNATETDVYSTKLLDLSSHTSRILRIRAGPLARWNIQLFRYLGIDFPFHKATERERRSHIDIFFVISEILVHVEEPAVLQAHIPFLYKSDENGILAHRSYRADKDCLLPSSVVFLYSVHHDVSYFREHFSAVSKTLYRDSSFLQFLCRI